MSMNEVLINSWADALFQIAEEQDMIGFAADTRSLLKILQNEPELVTIVADQRLLLSKRQALLFSLFNEKINHYFLNFLLLLAKQNHFRNLSAILEYFSMLADTAQNIVHSLVYSVVPLTKQQIEIIALKLQQKFSQDIKITNCIDKTLIGGVKIKLNDKILDGSIKGRLISLQQQLLKKGKGEY